MLQPRCRVWRLPSLCLLALALLGCLHSCRGEGGAVTVAQEDEPQLLGAADGTADASMEPPRAGDPMTELLHWAVKHSDPDKLKELMRKYQENNLTLKDVYGQETLDAMFVNEGSEMRDLIGQVADFRNASVEDGELEDAMERLQEFIEQIDNAGNLHRMGGLMPLLELSLSSERSPSTRAVALWTLGIAVQNNPPVQEDLLSLDGLTRLAAELPRCGPEAAFNAQYCGKLIFAVSGLVKNNETIQAAACNAGVFDWVLEKGAGHQSLPVAKKCMGLLETVLAQNPEVPFLRTLSSNQEALAQALLGHVRGKSGAQESDTDAAEKALRLLTRLLSLRPMLFPAPFQEELGAAVAIAMQRCERAYGADEELCEGLKSLADSANLMLTARDVSDDEL